MIKATCNNKSRERKSTSNAYIRRKKTQNKYVYRLTNSQRLTSTQLSTIKELQNKH
jgi:hypothetical protein